MNAKAKPDPESPSNLSAEKAILGAILLDNSLYAATTSLEAGDFYYTAHNLIYTHIGEMLDCGQSVDLVTLAESLRESKELDRIGETPVAYIADLSTDTIRYQPAVKDWVRIVKAKSLQRQLIAACTAATKKAYDGESGFTIISCLRERLDEIELSAKRGIRI
jgi:replicative DNA helicase